MTTGREFHVVYLTGAPASGKSTLSKGLAAKLVNLELFDYGKRLLEHVSKRSAKRAKATYEELRGNSDGLVSASDVAAVDALLLEWVEANRGSKHLIVDTHAVTKETFGFRVTPFNLEQIKALRPTLIVALYTPPEATIARIREDPGGRLNVTLFEAGFHAGLQASVAATYSILTGTAMYVVDTTTQDPLAWTLRKLGVEEHRIRPSSAGVRVRPGRT